MAPDQARYFRKLSAIERFSLGLNTFVKFNADIFVEGESRLTTERLQAAVDQAAEANPGSRVRLRGRLGFAKWVDSGLAPRVREIQAPAWDGRSGLGAAFLEEKFDAAGGGPVCEVIHVPGTPARIVFRSLHAAFDGSAVLHWACEIFRALRGEPLLGSPCTDTDWDIARKFRDKVNMDGVDTYTSLSTAQKPGGEAEGRSKSYLPVLACSPARAPGLRYVWRSVVFPAVISNAMTKSAIFLAEYARRGASGQVAFNVPVDLRERRAKVLSLGNLTGTLQIAVRPGDTTRSFTRQLAQQLANHVDCHRPFFLRLLPWIPMGVMQRLIKIMEPWLYEMRPGAITAGVTSLGPVPLHLLSAPDFSCTDFIAIPAYAGKMNLVVTITDRHTAVSIVVPERYNFDGQLDGLMEAIGREFGARQPPAGVPQDVA